FDGASFRGRFISSTASRCGGVVLLSVGADSDQSWFRSCNEKGDLLVALAGTRYLAKTLACEAPREGRRPEGDPSPAGALRHELPRRRALCVAGRGVGGGDNHRQLWSPSLEGSRLARAVVLVKIIGRAIDETECDRRT